MTSGSIPGVIFILQADSGNRYGPEIHLIAHAFHAIIANLAGIKITAITLSASIADFAIVKQAFLLFSHLLSPPETL